MITSLTELVHHFLLSLQLHRGDSSREKATLSLSSAAAPGPEYCNLWVKSQPMRGGAARRWF